MYSYAILIDELMLRNVLDLKGKLDTPKEDSQISGLNVNRNAQNELIIIAKKQVKINPRCSHFDTTLWSNILVYR